jgi:hypothetical protein
MTVTTKNYALVKPDFDIAGWHTDVNGNFDSIDSLLYATLGLGNVVGTWTNATNYSVSQRVFDPDDATMWNCLVDHASEPTGTFAEDRMLYPDRWNTVGSLPFVRGQWTNDTVYAPGDFSYDTVQSLVGVCNQFHTSSHAPASMRDDLQFWDVIADLSLVGQTVTSVNGEIGAVDIDADDIDDTATIQKFVSAAERAQIADHETRLDLLDPKVANHEARLVALETSGGGVTKASIWQVGMILPWTSATPPTATNDNGSTPAWLLARGATIGKLGSGATLRANDDMLPLYTHLWNNFANTELTIQNSLGSGTVRGADPATDFAALKRLPVPDCRGGVFHFADAGRGVITIANNSVTGARLGSQNMNLNFTHLPANIPATYALTFSGNKMGNHSHDYSRRQFFVNNVRVGAGTDNMLQGEITAQTSNESAGTPTGTITGTIVINAAGGTTAVPTLTPGIVLPSAIIKT